MDPVGPIQFQLQEKLMAVLLRQAAERSGCGQPTVLISRTEVTQDVFAKLAFNKSAKLHQNGLKAW